MEKSSKRVSVFLVSFLFVFSFVLQAQVTTGTLRGFVTDENGEPLPGVAIDIESTAMMTPRSAVTDGKGEFRFLYLPPGNYTLCARLEGFENCWVKGLPVQMAQIATANVVLKMGGLEETIEVTAEAPVVDTASSSKTYNVNLEMLSTVPLAPRMNFSNVWQTLPGVQGGSSVFVNATMTFQPPEQHWQDDNMENKVVIDGVEINDAMSGATYGRVNYEAIQEMDVKTAGASAEYGNARSAFMNIVTKSGGNQFQGSFFFEYQPESFNTTNVDDGTASRKSYAVPAVTLSGPIMKDKLWFLASYKYDNENYVFPDTVVTPDLTRRIRGHMPYIKFTLQAHKAHTLSFIFSSDLLIYHNNSFPSTRYSTLAAAQRFEGGGPTANVTWRWVVSDDTYFNFSAGYNRAPRSNYADNQVPRAQYTERFQGGSSLLYDNGYGEDYESIRENVHISTNLTKFFDDIAGTGSHEIKIGADFRPYQHITRSRIYHEDSLGFYQYRYGLDYANYGLTAPYVYRGYAARGAPGTSQNRYDNEVTVSNQNAYIQDVWTVNKNLTLSLGLRLEHQREFMHFREEIPENLRAVYSRMNDNVEFDDTDIAPRLGLTYNLENVGVFKFHFGRYFEYVGTGDYNNYARVIAFDEYRMAAADIGKGPEALQLYVLGPLSYNANYNDIDHMTMEYNDEFLASFERILFWNLAFETTFIYRKSSISWEEDVNAVFSNGQFVDRIFPDYDDIWKRTHYKGSDRRRSDDYKGLQFNLKRNFTGAWGMMMNYSLMWRTHTRLMFDPKDPQQFVYADASDLTRKNYGVRWSFHASAFYRLPLGFMISTYINGDSGQWINDMTGDYAWDASAPRVMLSNGRRVNDIVWQAKNSYFVGKKFGESGRYSDDIWTVNMRLSKDFRFNRYRVEGSIDVYNLFNFAAYSGYGSADIRRDYVDSSGVNQYTRQTGLQAPRVAALSLRFQF